MSSTDWQSFFRQELEQAEAASLLRRRRCHVETSDRQLQRRHGQLQINFGSNDYVGLRHDRRLALAVAQSLATLGVGAGASPLVSGYSSALAEFEQRLAAWQGTQSALVFSGGMSMNVGVIAALVGSDDLLLSDQLNHASLIDGCRLSGAHKRIYPHADAEAAEEILRSERHRYRRVVVITESVFSMDGDIAPLETLSALGERYEAGLIVDEAHASAVLGATGAGLGEELDLTSRWLAKLGTLSKGLGTCGGFVAGSTDLIDFLVNRCRTYIYSTAIAPPVVAASLAAVELMPELSQRRARVHGLSRRVRCALQCQGWRVPDGRTPIVPVIVGSSQRALALSQRLSLEGLFVPAIRPPTVPAESARLRISLSSAHTDQQVDKLLACLEQLVSVHC